MTPPPTALRHDRDHPQPGHRRGRDRRTLRQGVQGGRTIRQAREATHVHPHRQVLPLDIGGGHLGHVWVTRAAALANAGHVAGAITAFSALATRRAIQLDQLSPINFGVFENGPSRNPIGRVAVRGQLEAASDPRLNIGQKLISVASVPAANENRENEFCIGVDGGPRPRIASTLGSGLRTRDVLRLRVSETPNLIDLDLLAGKAAKGLVLIGAESRTGGVQQINDGVLGRAGDALNGPNAHAFTEKLQDASAFGGGELVHESYICPLCLSVKHERAI